MYMYICRLANQSFARYVIIVHRPAIYWFPPYTDRCFLNRSMGNSFLREDIFSFINHAGHKIERSADMISISKWSIVISARCYIMRLTVTYIAVLCVKSCTGVPRCASNQFPCVFIRIFSWTFFSQLRLF